MIDVELEASGKDSYRGTIINLRSMVGSGPERALLEARRWSAGR